MESSLNMDAVYNHNQFSMFNLTNNNIKEDREGQSCIIHELIGPEGNKSQCVVQVTANVGGV